MGGLRIPPNYTKKPDDFGDSNKGSVSWHSLEGQQQQEKERERDRENFIPMMQSQSLPVLVSFQSLRLVGLHVERKEKKKEKGIAGY